jgi:hypothetical protein
MEQFIGGEKSISVKATSLSREARQGQNRHHTNAKKGTDTLLPEKAAVLLINIKKPRPRGCIAKRPYGLAYSTSSLCKVLKKTFTDRYSKAFFLHSLAGVDFSLQL